jgi:hypothetical protein
LSGARAYGLPPIGGLAQVTEPLPVISPHQLLAPFGSPGKLIQREPRPRLDGHQAGGYRGLMKVSFAAFMPMQSQETVAAGVRGATTIVFIGGFHCQPLLLGASSAGAPTAPNLMPVLLDLPVSAATE